MRTHLNFHNQRRRHLWLKYICKLIQNIVNSTLVLSSAISPSVCLLPNLIDQPIQFQRQPASYLLLIIETLNHLWFNSNRVFFYEVMMQWRNAARSEDHIQRFKVSQTNLEMAPALGERRLHSDTKSALVAGLSILVFSIVDHEWGDGVAHWKLNSWLTFCGELFPVTRLTAGLS